MLHARLIIVSPTPNSFFCLTLFAKFPTPMLLLFVTCMIFGYNCLIMMLFGTFETKITFQGMSTLARLSRDKISRPISQGGLGIQPFSSNVAQTLKLDKSLNYYNNTPLSGSSWQRHFFAIFYNMVHSKYTSNIGLPKYIYFLVLISMSLVQPFGSCCWHGHPSNHIFTFSLFKVSSLLL